MAQQKDTASNPFGIQPDLNGFFSEFPAGMVCDARALMETQRRNIQAMAEAQQNAMENWQALAQKQASMVSRFVQDNADLAQQIMKEGTPEEKVARQAAIFKKAYEQSVAQSQEIAGMLTQSSKETADIISRRVSASIKEIKESLQNNKEGEAA
mgnify:CR=1 FL=1